MSAQPAQRSGMVIVWLMAAFALCILLGLLWWVTEMKISAEQARQAMAPIATWTVDDSIVFYNRISHQAAVCLSDDPVCMGNPFRLPVPERGEE